MSSRIPRRDFLRITVVSALTAGAPPIGCSDNDHHDKPISDDPAAALRVFPQGLASGDPKPDSIILWTRVEPDAGAQSGLDVTCELATDEAFKHIIAREKA